MLLDFEAGGYGFDSGEGLAESGVGRRCRLGPGF